MADARHVELCKLVAAWIQSGVYSFTFNVERLNLLRYDLADSNFTFVFVIPGNRALGTGDADTRESLLKTYQVRVHLLNFLDSNDISEEDDAQLLLQELEQRLTYQSQGDFEFLSYTADNASEPPFDVDRMAQQNFFYGQLTVNYLGN